MFSDGKCPDKGASGHSFVDISERFCFWAIRAAAPWQFVPDSLQNSTFVITSSGSVSNFDRRAATSKNELSVETFSEVAFHRQISVPMMTRPAFAKQFATHNIIKITDLDVDICATTISAFESQYFNLCITIILEVPLSTP